MWTASTLSAVCDKPVRQGYKNTVRWFMFIWSLRFDGFSTLCTFTYGLRVKMRLSVSLAFICILLPAGKNSKDKHWLQNWKYNFSIYFLSLFFLNGICKHFPIEFAYSVWLKVLHLLGCKPRPLQWRMDLSQSFRSLLYHHWYVDLTTVCGFKIMYSTV